MVKLASSYDKLLDLNTEIEQAAQQPDQFHTADTHYDAVSETLPAVDNPSDIEISDVEKTLNQIDQVQKESTKSQSTSINSHRDTENDADTQPEISDDPADALNENQTTTLESVFGNVSNQRSAQSDNSSDDQNDNQSRDDAMDRIRTQFNHHADEPTTPVNRDVETLGHGIDQQKVTPISQPKIDRSAGNKSLAAGTQSLAMLNDEDFDQQVDQLTQGIECEAKELAPSQPKLIVDRTDLTDDLPAIIAGTYLINHNDQNIIITKTKELPEIPDTSALEQQISDLQRELAQSNSRTEQLQTDKKQLLLQVQQLQSQIAQAASNNSAGDDQQANNEHLQTQNTQTANHQQAAPAAEFSAALVKIRQRLTADAAPVSQVEQIDHPSVEFKLISNRTLKSSDDRGAVIQQLMGSKPDSKFNQALQSADQIAVQVKIARTDVKPSLGSLSLLALTQARSRISVQFSQKDRKNNA